MKQHRTKALAHITQASGSMLLFALFTVCMLIMTAVAASAYSRINAGFDEAFGASVPLRYVSNRIRSADSAELLPDGNGAALSLSGVVCVIYCDGEAVYERSLPQGSAPAAQGGERIAAAQSLTITESGGLYTITVECAGRTSTALVRGGGGQ